MRKTVVTTRIVRRSVKSLKFTTLNISAASATTDWFVPHGQALLIASLLSAAFWSTLLWVAIG